MKKSILSLCLLFLFAFSFSSVKTFNLRKAEEIPNLDSLIKGLPTSYDQLKTKLKSQKTSMKDIFTLSYFKSLESNTKVKFYLNKEQKDFDSMVKDIISIMGISNPNHGYVNDVFKNKIPEHPEHFKFNTWMNYNIITTVRNDENTISYGSLFATVIEGKYYFIFCYGYENFKFNFSGIDAVFLGKEGDWKYVENSVCISTKDLDDYDTYYTIKFMNLVGFKVIGKEYGVELPYPELD